MAFSKAEQALLDKLAARGAVSVELVHGRGPQGGKVSHGAREYRAARNLENKGLVTVATHRSTLNVGNGHTCWVTSLTLTPTKKAEV